MLNTKPSMSAPSSAASMPSSSRVMPQILTMGRCDIPQLVSRLESRRSAYSFQNLPWAFSQPPSNELTTSLASGGFLATASPTRMPVNPRLRAYAASAPLWMPDSKTALAGSLLRTDAGTSGSVWNVARSREFTPATIVLAAASPSVSVTSLSLRKSSVSRTSTKACMSKLWARLAILTNCSSSRMRAIKRTASAPHR